MSDQLTILTRIQDIRSLVNATWKHCQLRQDKRLFSQLCSSMDAIEDTASAILAFEAECFPDTKPALYLVVYGLLQALYLQQDAVRHLAEALHSPIKLSDWPELEEIRRIRNTAVGHPTRTDRSRPVSFHHITQVTLSRRGFDMISYQESGEVRFRTVDLPVLISRQGEAISDILSKLIARLTPESVDHKERFRMEKLAQLFPPITSYYLEKVAESLHPEGEPRIGLFGLDGIESTLNEFREAIGRRDMDYYQALEHEYDLLRYAISSLRAFLEAKKGGQEAPTSDLAVEIFAAYVHQQTEKLRQDALEIDEDYAE